MRTDRNRQRGFSLVEVVVAIVILTMLATAFLSAFSVVLKNNASPLQTGLMEEIAASQLDKVLAGTFASAVALPASTAVNIDGTVYAAEFSTATVSGLAAASAVHVTVKVSCPSCPPGPTLSGDVYAIH